MGPKRCLFILYIGTHSHVLLDKLWPAVRTCSPEIITVPLIDSHNCWCLFPSRIDQWISNVSGGCVRTGVNDIDPHLNQHVTAAIFFHNPVFFCCRYKSCSKEDHKDKSGSFLPIPSAVQNWRPVLLFLLFFIGRL